MTAENFAYWLQGYFEILGEGDVTLTPQQTQVVKNHLNMVFVHDIDPKMGGAAHQAKLNSLHQGINVDNLDLVRPKPSVHGVNPNANVIMRC